MARAVPLVGVVHLQAEVAAVESQSETILVRLVQYAVSKIITGYIDILILSNINMNINMVIYI